MRDMEVALNKSGYFDETASKAITHVMKHIEVNAGEIWYMDEPNGPFAQVLVLKSCEEFCEIVMLKKTPFDKRDCEIDELHFDTSRIAYMHKKKLSTLDKKLSDEEFRRCMVEIARSMHFDAYLKGVPEKPVQDTEKVYAQIRKDISTDIEYTMRVLMGEIKALHKEEPQNTTKVVPEATRKLLSEEHDARVKAETEAQIYKQLNETLMNKLMGGVA